MTDAELDAMLTEPLPALDTTAFSVALMEAVARDAARPARILAWLCVGVLTVILAAAGALGAWAMSRGYDSVAPTAIPLALTALTLLLSASVFQAARE